MEALLNGLVKRFYLPRFSLPYDRTVCTRSKALVCACDSCLDLDNRSFDLLAGSFR